MIVLLIILGLFGLRYACENFALNDMAQSLCISSLGSAASPLTQALFCGEPLPSGPLKEFTLGWGLIHLIVISGAHLIFLENHIKKSLPYLHLPEATLFFVLGLFALATGLAAPLVRACLQALLSRVSRRFFWCWNSSQVIAGAGFLSLFFVDSSQCLSLQLSWCSALLIHLSRKFNFSELFRCIFIWIVLLPLLAGLTWSHPISIVANALFVSFFESVVFPFLWIQHNLLWWLPLNLSLPDLLIDLKPETMRAPQTDMSARWIYLLVLQSLCLFHFRKAS